MADGFTFDPATTVSDSETRPAGRPTGPAGEPTPPVRCFVYGKGLCFGSAPTGVPSLPRAGARPPCRTGSRERVYVYDPNHPRAGIDS